MSAEDDEPSFAEVAQHALGRFLDHAVGEDGVVFNVTSVRAGRGRVFVEVALDCEGENPADVARVIEVLKQYRFGT